VNRRAKRQGKVFWFFFSKKNLFLNPDLKSYQQDEQTCPSALHIVRRCRRRGVRTREGFFAIETKTWRVVKLLKVSGYVEAASGLLRGGLSP
jgi:hypothetical protein